MTQLSSQEIDQIVRDVMRQMGTLPQVSAVVSACASRLGSVSSVVPSVVASVVPPASVSERSPMVATAASAAVGPSQMNPSGSSVAVSPSSSLTECRLTSRLVTLESLPELRGLQRLVVPVRAIVTPAVQDELRRFGVRLEFDAAVSTASSSSSGVSIKASASCVAESTVGQSTGRVRQAVGSEVIFAVVRSRFTSAEGLQRAIGGEELKIHKSFFGKCLVQATDEFSASLAGKDRLGVLITDHTAVAMGLLNRRRGLRAVQAIPRNTVIANASAEAVVRDATEVGANLVVVDPREFGFWALRQVVVRFLKSGPYPCPETLRQRLD